MKMHRLSQYRSPLGALALLAAAAGCGGEPPPPASASEHSGAAQLAKAPRPAREGTVTLVTGDRVTLRKTKSGHTAHQIAPGPGRESIHFSIREHDGELSVLPSDVAPLVASGQLDRQLFDVALLLAEGYGDDQQRELPLLLTGLPEEPPGTQALRVQLVQPGVTAHRALPGLRALALRQRKDRGGAAIATLQKAALAAASAAATKRASSASAAAPPKLWLDRRLQLSLDQSVPQIGGPAAYARGLTGAGVTVAVLDSGVDATHPDLAGKIAAAASFLDGDPSTADPVGHGTHVASIIAGSGAASSNALHGVAPGATLLNGRVCGLEGCPFSAILAGLEWAAVAQDADIVNLSLGGADTPELDPIEEAINTLSAQRGTLFVVSAGNSGAAGTVASPSSADAALSVGAVTSADRLARFSSQGPRTGDHAIKPDLTAPGAAIAAARAAGTNIGSPVGEHYTRLSGTSMAAPHVAGAAALLLQQHPTWSGAQLKAALMSSAHPNDTLTVYQQGAGRLDVDRATAQLLTAEPASLSFGITSYPHHDDAPLVRTVRYHNAGAAPVTLTLAAGLRRGAVAAPAAMISIAPAELTVAAGATAEAQLTIDTSVEAPDGLYGGALIATSDAASGGARLVTPLGVEREVESADLTVRVLGTNGQPGEAFVSLKGVAARGTPVGDTWVPYTLVTGQAVLRVPVGTYVVDSFDEASQSWLLSPRTHVPDATTLVMDSRLAVPFELQLPEPGLAVTRGVWSYRDDAARAWYGELFSGPTSPRTAQVGPSAPSGESATFVNSIFASTPSLPLTTYHVARQFPDQFRAGWQETLHRRDFAEVTAGHANARPAEFLRWIGAVEPDSEIQWQLSFLSYPSPFQRTEHFYGPGLSWSIQDDEVIPDPSGSPLVLFLATQETIQDVRPGTRTRQTWHQAPFGPGFAARTMYSHTFDFSSSPKRLGEILSLQPSLFSDQAPQTRRGTSLLESGRITLLREGEVIDELPGELMDLGLFTPVPPEPAQYRLEAEATRSAELFELSTGVSAAWTFRSQFVADEHVAALSLPTLRFAPPLDEHNRTAAPALLMPIRVERSAGAPPPRITDARVEASFDDGATWHRVPLIRIGDQALGLVVHPRDASYVSLRGTARDVAGNSVDQTILRAYALARP